MKRSNQVMRSNKILQRPHFRSWHTWATLAMLCVAPAISPAGPEHAHSQMTPELITQELAKLDQLYRVAFADRKDGYLLIRSYHSEIREVFYDEGYAVLSLTEPQRETLTNQGYTLTPATQWRIKRRMQLAQSQSRLSLSTEDDKQTDTITGRAVIPGFECYQDVESTIESANALVTEHPTLASMIDIGDSWNKENGFEGYDLWVLRLTNQEIDTPKPVLFIQSAMHAREYTTAQLTLEFAQRLLNEYGTNADTTWILNHHDIQILLHANPDGRKIAETGLLWRKNTNVDHCPEALMGVDLNRNYSLFWNYDDLGSSANPCAPTFRGSLAASEPETNAVETYIRTLFPDQRGPEAGDAAPLDTSGIHLDIHSFGELILWPWGHTPTPSGNELQLRTLGRKFAYQTDYFPTQATGLGLTNGTSDEVSYGELGVAAYTFELGTTFFQDCGIYENDIREPNLTALKYAAKVVRAPYQLPSGPEISLLTLNGSQNIQLLQGDELSLNILADDTLFSSANGAEPNQAITGVNLYWNTLPWEAENPTLSLTPADGNQESPIEAFNLTVNTNALPVGRHTLYAQAHDASGQVGPIRAAFVDIYPEDFNDPDFPELPPDYELPEGASIAGFNLILMGLLAIGRRYRLNKRNHRHDRPIS